MAIELLGTESLLSVTSEDRLNRGITTLHRLKRR